MSKHDYPWTVSRKPQDCMDNHPPSPQMDNHNKAHVLSMETMENPHRYALFSAQLDNHNKAHVLSMETMENPHSYALFSAQFASIEGIWAELLEINLCILSI